MLTRNYIITIPGTQVQAITSSIATGQEYQLFISLPAGYGDTTKKFPVCMFSTGNGILHWRIPFLQNNILMDLSRALSWLVLPGAKKIPILIA
jgi:hypothetical protein